MNGYIYSITNTSNGKRYIGSTGDINDRWKSHRNMLKRGKHHCSHLQSSYNKWGADVFEYEILLHCDTSIMFHMEELSFDIFRSTGLFNTKPTACGGAHRKGAKLSDETKEKLSNLNKGKKFALGVKHTDEARKNMSVAHIGKKYPNRKKPEPKSPETRAKQAASLRATLAAKRLEGQLLPPADENREVTSDASVESGPALLLATDVSVQYLITINK